MSKKEANVYFVNLLPSSRDIEVPTVGTHRNLFVPIFKKGNIYLSVLSSMFLSLCLCLSVCLSVCVSAKWISGPDGTLPNYKWHMSYKVRKHTFLHIWAQQRLIPACTSTQSNQSLHCLHEEILHPWLSKMHPVKILIRFCKCMGWSESLLGARLNVHSLMIWLLSSFNPCPAE